jgi:hypothetical protein
MWYSRGKKKPFNDEIGSCVEIIFLPEFKRTNFG